MILVYDPVCATYEAPEHPERPERVLASATHLSERHPTWEWRLPRLATNAEILRVHTLNHLKRFDVVRDFDADTAWLPGILDHARRAAGGAIEVAELALQGKKAFSLMRPPGHHALAEQAMGFCYLNSITIAALLALDAGVERVAIWDFDAHHGNGTEELVRGNKRILFASVHQLPGWPGSGGESFENIWNFPVRPMSPRALHLAALEKSYALLADFKPDLLLVSAGFDVFAEDPITNMTLLEEDFATLGAWLGEFPAPVGAILEGGYSDRLPWLIDAFLTAWDSTKSSGAKS
ncbi:MAG TPA: histone deacetylase [Chthoniobacterales bacterium]